MAREKVAVACAREEAEVLGIAPPRDREAGLLGELANLALVHRPSGKLIRASDSGASAEST